MLSNTCKYAIRAVVYLSLYSSESKKVGIKQISRELDIPTPFLGKILQVLAKHKVLISTKGPNGGFGLGRDAHDIPLMDIVEVVDGTAMFDTCLIRTTKCADEAPCALHDKVSHIRKELKSMFVTQTIADLASEFRQGHERIQI
mgnify:CR=1 FL=1